MSDDDRVARARRQAHDAIMLTRGDPALLAQARALHARLAPPRRYRAPARG